jgi:hypothetical protein
MFQTLSNVQSGEAVPLQQCIDNRPGTLTVGLRSLVYTVGWYNVSDNQTVWWQQARKTNIIDVPPGLWSFINLKALIESRINNSFKLDVDKKSGLFSMTVPTGLVVAFSGGLRTLLGLDNTGWLPEGAYKGVRPVNFMTKTLHVHLEQINTTKNILDGAPSTLLGVVGVGCHPFGATVPVYFPNPEFKLLQGGTLGELKVYVLDDSKQKIDNHKLSISVVLEIR